MSLKLQLNKKMNVKINKQTFLLKYKTIKIKVKTSNDYYSEKHDLHVLEINKEYLPYILSSKLLPEVKTITEISRERED